MKTVGVFFGGKNPEHEISIITGQLIIAGLKKLGYKVTPMYLDKKGRWFTDERLGDIKFFQNPNKDLNGFNRFFLDLENSSGKMVLKSKGLFSEPITIDIAFPALHGQNGEDGTIQGFFEILNIPYAGCDVASSAIAIDKVHTKLLYEKYGLPTTKFIYFTTGDWQKNKKEILKKIKQDLKWPVFVKPARLGSSIGIAKIKKPEDLEIAIEVALHYDEKTLVEESVENLMDVTCAVLGNENPRPSLLQESIFGDAFFTYEEKYIKGGGAQTGQAQKSIIIPARLDEKTTNKIQDMALLVFKLFGCSGTARVDFLYNTRTKKFYVNEVNTLPGTLYHHLWDKSGVNLDKLLTELLRLAEEKHGQKKKITCTIETDVLKYAGASNKLKLNL